MLESGYFLVLLVTVMAFSMLLRFDQVSTLPHSGPHHSRDAWYSSWTLRGGSGQVGQNQDGGKMHPPASELRVDKILEKFKLRPVEVEVDLQGREKAASGAASANDEDAIAEEGEDKADSTKLVDGDRYEKDLDLVASSHVPIDEDDASAWAQTLDSLAFVQGPYRHSDGHIREIVPVKVNKSESFQLWVRRCGSTHADMLAADQEDCSQYPTWSDLILMRAGTDGRALQQAVDDLPHSPRFNTRSTIPATKSTLIVLTASNEIGTTLACLDSLKGAAVAIDADICIIDDFSEDGTASYLRKIGYYVIKKPQSSGLSLSWNIGYELAALRSYQYLFIINNDVIVSSGALKEMRMLLENEVLVVPMTTKRGAGSTLAQDVVEVLRQSVDGIAAHNVEAFEKFVDNPRNTEIIQAAVNQRYSGQTAPLVSPVRFNGFFFGCNVSALHGIAYRAGAHMFSPKYPWYYEAHILDMLQDRSYQLVNAEKTPMVGQETWLAQRMVNASLKLKLRWGGSTRWDMHGVAHGKTAALSPKEMAERKLPLPKLALGAFVYHFKSITLQRGMQRLQNSSDENNPCGIRNTNDEDIRDDYRLYHSDATSQGNIKNPWKKEMQQRGGEEHWPTAMSRRGASSLVAEPVLYPPADGGKMTTVAMVVSNARTNPAAGDLMTAGELEAALLKVYPFQLRIIYLHQGKDWYDAHMIAQADVLISFLDTWDASRALYASAQQKRLGKKYAQLPAVAAKSNVVVIGWARNWFHRWLSRPWVGHFDMLLVSSRTALRVMREVAQSVGMPTKCLHSCPKTGVPLPEGQARRVSGYRRNVRIELLLLASNLTLFQCPEMGAAGATSTTDYLIPVSYHKQPRAVMSLDPAVLWPYRGRLIGSNWDMAFNASAVSSELYSLWTEAAPYHSLPKAYSKALVIIDDANKATKAWGSVNSRVFDALACSRLVVTDGEKGSRQIFEGHLPYWNSSATSLQSSKRLRQVLRRFVTTEGHPTASYKQAQAALTAQVHANHSYTARARSLGGYLGDFGIALHDKQGEIAADSSRKVRHREHAQHLASRRNRQICMGVRTMPTQYGRLSLLLASLLQQQAAQSGAEENLIDLHLFVVNTQTHTRHNRLQLQGILEDINTLHGGAGRSARLLYDPLAEELAEERRAEKCTPMGTKAAPGAGLDAPNALFGYEESDMLLSYLLRQWQQRDIADGFKCDWIGFTNGDNMFASSWLAAIAPALLAKYASNASTEAGTAGTGEEAPVPVQMIAWDFTTHHLRPSPEGMQPNQLIRVDLDRRGYVDLSSFLVNTHLVARTGACFLPDAPFTTEIFARDFFFVKQLRKGMLHDQVAQSSGVKQSGGGAQRPAASAGVLYVHQNLLLHQ